MRQQKFDLARQTLEPLRTASDRQLQKQAEMLLESIKRYQDQVAQSNAIRDSSPARPELARRESTEESTTEAPQKTESDYLREALRPVGAGEQRIQGMFMKLDCDNKGVAYFTVQASDRTYRIRSTVLQQVQLTA